MGSSQVAVVGVSGKRAVLPRLVLGMSSGLLLGLMFGMHLVSIEAPKGR